MKEAERWKPWFDHKKKAPTMTREPKPNVGYVKWADYEAERARRIRAENLLWQTDLSTGEPAQIYFDEYPREGRPYDV